MARLLTEIAGSNVIYKESEGKRVTEQCSGYEAEKYKEVTEMKRHECEAARAMAGRCHE